QIARMEAVALGRDQDFADNAEVSPDRVAQVAATAQHAQQLVGGVRNPGGAGLPIADGALADAQQVGATTDSKPAGEAGFPEAARGDRKTLPFRPVRMADADPLGVRIMPIMFNYWQNAPQPWRSGAESDGCTLHSGGSSLPDSSSSCAAAASSWTLPAAWCTGA